MNEDVAMEAAEPVNSAVSAGLPLSYAALVAGTQAPRAVSALRAVPGDIKLERRCGARFFYTSVKF